MDIRKIKKLIELLEESGLAEIEVRESKDGEESVRISRLPPAGVEHMVRRTTAEDGSTQPIEVSGSAESEGTLVKAPLVGTFYRAPAQDARNFVEVGQTVEKGQTLCIIEAMKTMNQIEADRSGVIAAVFVENAHPVEFAQPLMLIK